MQLDIDLLAVSFDGLVRLCAVSSSVAAKMSSSYATSSVFQFPCLQLFEFSLHLGDVFLLLGKFLRLGSF